MAIKTIKNECHSLEVFAKQLHEQALQGKIKPIAYNQQQTSTLRYQRFKLNHNKFSLLCEDGDNIVRVGWINFIYEVIKKGNEGVKIDFDKARFPFIMSQIRNSAIVDVEEVEEVEKVEEVEVKEEPKPVKKARVKRPKE